MACHFEAKLGRGRGCRQRKRRHGPAAARSIASQARLQRQRFDRVETRPLAQVQLRVQQIGRDLDPARLEFEDAGERRCRFAVTTERLQDMTEIGEDLDRVRAERGGLAAARQRFLVPAFALERETVAVVGGAEPGVLADYGGEFGDRLGRPAEIDQDMAAIDAGADEGWLVRDRGPVRGFGFVQALQTHQRIAERVVGFGELWPEPDCTA
jgi:hypothetical protein